MSTIAVVPAPKFSICLTTNEYGQREALERFDKLASMEEYEGGELIGGPEIQEKVAVIVSGMGGLNFISRRADFSKIIAVDVSPETARLWELIAHIIRDASSRVRCASRIRNAVRIHKEELFKTYHGLARNGEAVRTIFGSPPPCDEDVNRSNNRLNIEVFEGLSWLSDQTRFERIQDIFRTSGGFSFL